MNNAGDLTAVYDAANELEAQILQDVLKDNGIPSLLRPRSSLPSAYAPASIHGAVSIWVLDPLAERARGLIASDIDEAT